MPGLDFDIAKAREDGYNDDEIKAELQRRYAEVMPAMQQAFEDGYSPEDVYSEVQGRVKKAKEATYGTIGPDERGFLRRRWDDLKTMWNASLPDTDPMTLPQDRSFVGKLGSAALGTVAVPIHVLNKYGEEAERLGGEGAAKLAEAAPGLPAAVPATIGFVGSELATPMNWVGGGPVREAAALEKAAVRPGWLGRANDVLRDFQYHPEVITDQARAVAQLGRAARSGVGRLLKGGRGGAEVLEEAAQTAGRAQEAPLAAPGGLQEPSVPGQPGNLPGAAPEKAPESMGELEKALEKRQIQSWQELSNETRLRDISEVLGGKPTVEAEEGLAAQFEAARRTAKEEGAVVEPVQPETKFGKPWEKKPTGPAEVPKPEETVTKKLAKQQQELKNPRTRGKVVEEQQASTMLDTLKAADETADLSLQTERLFPNLPEQGVDFSPPNLKEGSILNLPKAAADSVAYLAKRFFADPSTVIPRMASEAGRVFDAMNRTKHLFYEGVGNAIKPLSEAERDLVAVMLDTNPKDWLKSLAELGYNETQQADLITPKVMGAYKELRAIMSKLADVEGLPQYQRISDYFPHIFDNKAAYANKGVALADEGIFVKAAKNRFHNPRAGGLGYSMKLEDALTVRISHGLRKAYFNTLVKNFEGRLGSLGPGAREYAEAYLAKLQGRPVNAFGIPWDKLDAFLKERYGKGLPNLAGLHGLNRSQLFFTMNYYRGLLGLAVDTAFKNLGQVQNTVAEVGFGATGKGLGRVLLSPEGRRVFNKAGVIDDYQRIVDAQAEMLNRSQAWKAFDKVLFSPMQFSEYVNRGTAFHGGLIDAYKRGLRGQQAVEYAKQVVNKTQFRYGLTNTSPYLQNPLGKLAYQFSTYPVKEIEFIRDVLKDPDKRKLYRLLAFHGMAVGGGIATGTTLHKAMGWTDVAIPGTGNKETGEPNKTVPMPIDLLTHFLDFTAPTPTLAKDASLAIGELIDKGEVGERGQKAINDLLNMVPARRYLEKLWLINQKLEAGYNIRPRRTQEILATGETAPREPREAATYGTAEAAKEAVGIKPRD